MSNSSDPARELFQAHQRTFQGNRYVYPVLSRRAGGISIGINLNRDKTCNFNCVYCQVDRSSTGESQRLELQGLSRELDEMIELVVSGGIYQTTKFRDAPKQLRRLNDVALSGDGEPTACSDFEAVVDTCVATRARHRLDDVKLVLITNASLLHRDPVRRSLAALYENNGEIWAKLDAGTDTYFHRIARTGIKLQRILDNLAEAARVRPIVIQTLLMRIDGQGMARAEREAYCDRLGAILAAGGRIEMVQLHTIARQPADARVTPASNAQIDAVAELVGRRTGLPVATF